MPDHTDAAPFLAPATTPPEPESPLHKSHATPPPTPGERAKWTEAVRGRDPKCDADRRRRHALGGDEDGDVYQGAYAGAMDDATRELVRGPAPGPFDDVGPHLSDQAGIDDDVPDLPPPLAEQTLRPRWEAFCRLYAFGHSASDAARHAGYAWGSAAHSGWRLLQDDRVRSRIAELQGHLARALAIDEYQLALRAEAVYREAMNRGHYGAAIRALEFAARHLPGEIGGNGSDAKSREMRSTPGGIAENSPKSENTCKNKDLGIAENGPNMVRK